MLPLSGVHVIDFTRVLAGPFCSMNLADLGADVIKVESLDGDETRGWGPPFAGKESAYFLCVNRNKRSIAVNLATVEGQDVACRLIRSADVVLHNFLPESAEKLGLTYDQVQAIRADVIYASISGYGRDVQKPGYDYIMQAMGGMMSITGDAEGAPFKVGVAITDVCTGLYATIAIEAALMVRERTGKGQSIDLALYDTQIAMLANVASNVLMSEHDAPRFGNEHPNIVPYQLFQTSDVPIIITVGNDRQFHNFCDALELPALYDDERFATNAQRVHHRELLCTLLEDHIVRMSAADVTARLEEAGVPCGPVRSVKEALAADETARREMIWPARHRDGLIRLVGSPLKLSETPPQLRLGPPSHGEHTVEILTEVGYRQHEIDGLVQMGVVLQDGNARTASDTSRGADEL